MPPVDRPWTRVRTPDPIPDPCSAEVLHGMPIEAFAQLLRCHLVPRDQSSSGRKAWTHLWEILRGDDDLADRAYDVLEGFLAATQSALDAGDLDPDQRSRAIKFIAQCQQSWQRIDRGPRADTPLAWAGSAGDFPPPARRVIATLIAAIAHHRTVVQAAQPGPRAADHELWTVMGRVSLDPDDYAPSQPRRS